MHIVSNLWRPLYIQSQYAFSSLSTLVVAAFAITLLSACYSKEDKHVFTYPLVKECRQEAESFFNDHHTDMEVEFVQFNHSLKALPTLEGFVSIKGSKNDAFKINAVFNAILLKCYPVARVVIKDNPASY